MRRLDYIFWGFLVAGIAITVMGWIWAFGKLGEMAQPLPSPTPSPALTPTPTPTPGWWMKLRFTPGLPATAAPAVKPTPTKTPAPKPKCTEGVQIDAPSHLEILWGDILHIFGTADIPNFWYYKVEMQPEGGQEWQVLYRSEKAVRKGKLMEWHTETVAPGKYTLRLMVVDRTGNYPSPCEIQVLVRSWW